MITFDDIRNNPDIRAYVQMGDNVMKTIGFTEHSFQHATLVAKKASDILGWLKYSDRQQELARIAGFMHDIGNSINRIDHAQSGAVMAFRLLDKIGMPAEEIGSIIGAIGNHDEGTGNPISPVSAALILADKSDVRRTRVRNRDFITFDIHDRVNYAVEESQLLLDEDGKTITLMLKVDTEISPVMDYFEIFLSRMLMCRKAADFLGVKFRLSINGNSLL